MSCFRKIIDFLTPNQKTDIELFIESRNPKNTSDVEHLIKQYTYRKN